MLVLKLRTEDSLACDQEVVLDGRWKGVVRRHPERYHGIGTVIVELEPVHPVQATMAVGPLLLEARERKFPQDNVWNEAGSAPEPAPEEHRVNCATGIIAVADLDSAETVAEEHRDEERLPIIESRPVGDWAPTEGLD